MRRGRASPCIGVCSTTYGDLVCRGCNRFAHEVVQWNTYDEEQRAVVWGRLEQLRDGSVARHLSLDRVTALCDAAAAVDIRYREELSDASLAYEVLRRMAVRRLPLPWGEGGDAEAPTRPRTLLASIDQEIHGRSRAIYERNYKVPAE